MHRAGHDQAGTGHGEVPVDGEPEATVSTGRDVGACRGLQQAGEVVDARPRQRRTGDDRRSREAGTCEEGMYLRGHRGDALRVGAVGLRHGDDATVEAEKVEETLEAPAAGTLAEILVDEGDTVEVRTVVAVIETA